MVEQRAAADAEVVDFPLVAQHLAQLIRIGLSSAGADTRGDAVADAGHADGVLVILDADGRVGISRGGGLRQHQQEQHDGGHFEAGELHGGFRLQRAGDYLTKQYPDYIERTASPRTPRPRHGTALWRVA